jgi:hypothetical protein
MSDPAKPTHPPTNSEPDQQAIDPRELVTKPGLAADQDPREVVSNPAVTPEMLNEPGDIRSDLIDSE